MIFAANYGYFRDELYYIVSGTQHLSLGYVDHSEIPAKGVKRASTFYSKAFGWSLTQFPSFEYWSVGTTPSDQSGSPTAAGAINGGLGKKGVTAPNAVTVTVSVADIDAALASVKKLGGKVIGKKTPVGDIGFSAYFEDTEGNVIGLWQRAGT